MSAQFTEYGIRIEIEELIERTIGKEEIEMTAKALELNAKYPHTKITKWRNGELDEYRVEDVILGIMYSEGWSLGETLTVVEGAARPWEKIIEGEEEWKMAA